jgi:hypothetical protein
MRKKAWNFVIDGSSSTMSLFCIRPTLMKSGNVERPDGCTKNTRASASGKSFSPFFFISALTVLKTVLRNRRCGGLGKQKKSQMLLCFCSAMRLNT